MPIAGGKPERAPDWRFTDRADAGRRLAASLDDANDPSAVVLGLPRGGVVVAAEVSRLLARPLDVIVVRKLGVPGQRELAMGAVGEEGVVVVNDRVMAASGLSRDDLDRVALAETEEVSRRASRYRSVRARVDLSSRTALIVDDGIATGATAHAACSVARAHGASRVVLAVPVAPPGAREELRSVADDVIVLVEPPRFFAVGEAYLDFRPVTDEEVVAILERSAA